MAKKMTNTFLQFITHLAKDWAHTLSPTKKNKIKIKMKNKKKIKQNKTQKSHKIHKNKNKTNTGELGYQFKQATTQKINQTMVFVKFLHKMWQKAINVHMTVFTYI
jgi:DNA topoisomerase VI subunit A